MKIEFMNTKQTSQNLRRTSSFRSVFGAPSAPEGPLWCIHWASEMDDFFLKCKPWAKFIWMNSLFLVVKYDNLPEGISTTGPPVLEVPYCLVFRQRLFRPSSLSTPQWIFTSWMVLHCRCAFHQAMVIMVTLVLGLVLTLGHQQTHRLHTFFGRFYICRHPYHSSTL